MQWKLSRESALQTNCRSISPWSEDAMQKYCSKCLSSRVILNVLIPHGKLASSILDVQSSKQIFLRMLRLQHPSRRHVLKFSLEMWMSCADTRVFRLLIARKSNYNDSKQVTMENNCCIRKWDARRQLIFHLSRLTVTCQCWRKLSFIGDNHGTTMPPKHIIRRSQLEHSPNCWPSSRNWNKFLLGKLGTRRVRLLKLAADGSDSFKSNGAFNASTHQSYLE